MCAEPRDADEWQDLVSDRRTDAERRKTAARVIGRTGIRHFRDREMAQRPGVLAPRISTRKDRDVRRDVGPYARARARSGARWQVDCSADGREVLERVVRRLGDRVSRV